LFAITALAITPSGKFSINTPNDPYLIAVPIMAIGSFIASMMLHRQLIATAVSKPTVQQKIVGYQTAMIVRLALLEGASLFGIVVYIVTTNLLYLGISGVLIAFFITLRPTRDKIETDLNLDYQDKADLDSDGISNEQKY